MPNDKYIEITLDLLYQTDFVLICRDGDDKDDKQVTIPKSLIQDPDVITLENLANTADLSGKYPSVTLTIPEWFAIQEELV